MLLAFSEEYSFVLRRGRVSSRKRTICQGLEPRSRVDAKTDRHKASGTSNQLSNVDNERAHAVEPVGLWCGEFRSGKGHILHYQSRNLDEQYLVRECSYHLKNVRGKGLVLSNSVGSSSVCRVVHSQNGYDSDHDDQ